MAPRRIDLGQRRERALPGVTHHRTIVVLRQGLVLVLDDQSSSDKPHEYAQTWHLAPEVERVREQRRRTPTLTNAAGKPTLHDPSGRSRRA